MKEALVEIEAFNTNELAKDFFREGKLRVGSEIEIAKGIFLRFEGITLREAVGVPEGKEAQVNKDTIKEILLKEIRERPPLKKYFCRLSFPEFSEDELERAARTLSCKPIIFNERELPYPDNLSYFAEYWLGNVETIVHIRDEEINQLYEEGKLVYAKAQIDERLLPRLFFTNLILSSQASPCKMKEIKKEEDMPSWY